MSAGFSHITTASPTNGRGKRNRDHFMDHRQTTTTLQEIYRLFDGYLSSLAPGSIACRKTCADCCTANVTMTRLEGLLIRNSVDREQITAKLPDIYSTPFLRYRPALSTNGYVLACKSGDDGDLESFAEEQYPEGAPSVCPFLENNLCTIYSVRPFGCRCMLSTRPCAQTGCADIDELTLTVSTVFLQFIEHIDKDGFFGNMTDVLYALSADQTNAFSRRGVIANHPIPALMVPPEHRGRMQDIVFSLNRLLAGQPPAPQASASP